MAALSALSTASTLLQQQMASSTGSSAPARGAMLPAPRIEAGVSTAIGPAAKSFSSAVFNAVTAAGEKKQDRTAKAVLDFIDREYTNIDKKFANSVKAFGHEEGFQASIADAKMTGEVLKRQVLDDPEGIQRRLEQIKATRPNMALEGTIGILIRDLNRQNGR